MKKRFKVVTALLCAIMVLPFVGCNMINSDSYQEITATQRLEFIQRIEKLQSEKQQNYQVVDRAILYGTEDYSYEYSEDYSYGDYSKISFNSIYDYTKEDSPLVYCEFVVNALVTDLIKNEKGVIEKIEQTSAEINGRVYIDVKKHEAYVDAKKHKKIKYIKGNESPVESNDDYKGTIHGIDSFREIFGITFSLDTVLTSFQDDTYKVSADGDNVIAEKKELTGKTIDITDAITKEKQVLESAKCTLNTINFEKDNRYTAQMYVFNTDRYESVQDYYFSEIKTTKKTVSLPSDLTEYSKVINIYDLF